MTYKFSCCEVCKEQRLECQGSGNMCSRCRRDKKVPKVWSYENNMDPMCVPEELSGMSDAEQMLIARLAPTVHVGPCTYFEAWRYCFKGTLYCFPSGCAGTSNYSPTSASRGDIIRVRRQGRDDTHKDFRVRRYRVQEALCWLKDNNPAYSDICCPHTQSTRR